MTTTSGPSARHGGPVDPRPRAVDPRDAPAGPAPSASEAAGLCDQARDLAESGHLDRAAELYRGAVAADPPPDVLARALLGLAVVEDGRGDTAAARDAARRALDTGDARHAPRAAHHLALSLEQDGEGVEAERVWRRLLDLGGSGHAAVAHYGLARAAEERGDPGAAEEHWEAALAPPPERAERLHAETVAEAARDLAGRLLGRGAPGAALSAADRGLSAAEDPELRLLRAAAHLEHAIADLDAVLEPPGEGGEPAAPPTAGAAVELLAGLLALRGDAEGAAGVWRGGLRDLGDATAEEVGARLRRGFAHGGEEDGEPWWEPYLTEAVATASAPALAAELFAVLTRMHALAALPALEGEANPARLREALVQAVRTPDELVWGPGLHADLRRRLAEATGERDLLPEDWPEGL
ncbi:tetratricopeptide repeat protein [Nocardiopsis changdeensis]|uniref:Tetratricopeptide repeat protein n=1 Tax=Nocardiopsis changdeensis TaxID=2831969 RepID=A0ABX8BFB3_9ACTN|nr:MULTISPECIES: tetratricopeptide repeat protein [Nocardiopsis]QUX20944.1 tetratricopeptide repeat protein [Nocardiopsis changdeensis]QYX36875.1 tetratricopeptide repeat protein [Nocardiopsis sp. MT53]